MNELQELLQNINPSFIGRYGRSSLSSVLAKAEQVIFDKLLKSREISDTEGARSILAQLHSGDNPTSLKNFDAYVGQLFSLKKKDKFAVDLAELMTEVNNSENPQAVLEELVWQERASGLVVEQDILPEGFWGRRAPVDPEITAATARFNAEFNAEPTFWEETVGRVKGFLSSPGIPSASSHLTNWDFGQISDYFTNQQNFSDLTSFQQELVETMRFTPEDFSALGSQAPRFHELREQLRNELASDNILSQSEIEKFVGIKETFEVAAENFGLHFASSLGEEVSMPTQFSNIKDFVTGGEESVGLLARSKAEDVASALVGREQVEQVKGFVSEVREGGLYETLRGRAVGAVRTKLENIFGNMEPELAERVFTGVYENGGQAAVNDLVGLDQFGTIFFNTESYGLKAWAKHQASSLAMAPIITPLVNLVASLTSPEHTERTKGYINIGLAAYDLLSTMRLGAPDPTGIIIASIQAIMAETKRLNKRVKDNENPESFRGDRLGYVRSGNSWMPAMLAKKEQSTSTFSGDTNFTLEYGEHLIFVPMGDGTAEAFFENPRYEDFMVHDWELTDTNLQGAHFYSKEHVDNFDGQRNWYLLPPDTSISEANLERHDIDYDAMTSWERNMQDWRRGLELSQIWYNNFVKTNLPGVHVGETPSNRALRNLSLVNWYGQQQILAKVEIDYQDLGWDHNWTKDENQYLKNDIFMAQFKSLILAQRLAAEEQHYDRDYRKDFVDEAEGKQTIWSSIYLDYDRSVETANTADELEAQLENIHGFEDRTLFQKNYLAQKCMVRFWLRQISERGGGNDFLDFTLETTRGQHGEVENKNPEPFLSESYTQAIPGNVHVEQHWPTSDTIRWSSFGGMPIIPTYEEAQDVTDEGEGWVMPWSNQNESIVPDFFFEGLNSENQEYFLSQSQKIATNLKTVLGDDAPFELPEIKTRENIAEGKRAQEEKRVDAEKEETEKEETEAGKVLKETEQRLVTDVLLANQTFADAIVENVRKVLGGPTVDDLVEHFEKNVEVLYDKEGEPAGLTFEGETLNMFQHTTPDVEEFDWGELDAFEKLEKQLELEGHEPVEREFLTQEHFPEYSWKDDVPLFGHDEELEEELGLPDDILAVMGSNGVVVKAFNPFHTIATEGVTHD